jgi:hypothetical protein
MRCCANVPSQVTDRPADRCSSKATVIVGALLLCRLHAKRWERVLGVKSKPMHGAERSEK